MADYYLWIKVLHIVAVISWMAGLLYLPRLFVYHVERGQGIPRTEEMFQLMERRLIRGIMNPAMIVAWACGLLMAWIGGPAIWGELWFWFKFTLICLMTGFHHWASLQRKALARGQFKHNGRYYRIRNEIPAVLMILIVILVIIKPF